MHGGLFVEKFCDSELNYFAMTKCHFYSTVPLWIMSIRKMLGNLYKKLIKRVNFFHELALRRISFVGILKSFDSPR